MSLQISQEFYLEEFEPWGGAVSRYEEIEELDIMEQAQEYIEEMFSGSEVVTITSINDMLWFGMDDFIESYLTERAEEILDAMLAEALEHGTLYEITTSNNEMKLVASMDAQPDEQLLNDWYGYYDLDEDTVYIEDEKLYVVNNEVTSVSSYMVDLDTGRVLLDDVLEL